MKVITLAWLRKHEACQFALDTFKKLFGQRAEITPANLTRAARTGVLPLDWVVQEIPKLADQYERERVGFTKMPHKGLDSARCPRCRKMKAIPRRILLEAAGVQPKPTAARKGPAPAKRKAKAVARG